MGENRVHWKKTVEKQSGRANTEESMRLDFSLYAQARERHSKWSRTSSTPCPRLRVHDGQILRRACDKSRTAQDQKTRASGHQEVQPGRDN
eukprot:1708951-Pleurochrysis_carterae.AAC.2